MIPPSAPVLRYNFLITEIVLERSSRTIQRVGGVIQRQEEQNGWTSSLSDQNGSPPLARRRRSHRRGVTRELGYTRQYISGRFHRLTGRLLSHFLKEKRLEKAARLLKSGNLRVSQIARRCGFDSENYFRQQFRERYGMSPRQFRTNGNANRLAPRRLMPQAQTA